MKLHSLYNDPAVKTLTTHIPAVMILYVLPRSVLCGSLFVLELLIPAAMVFMGKKVPS